MNKYIILFNKMLPFTADTDDSAWSYFESVTDSLEDETITLTLHKISKESDGLDFDLDLGDGTVH